MKWKLSCISLLLLTVLMLGSPAFAGPGNRQKPEDTLDKLLREGWKPVAPGVLQINKGDNKVETFAIGPEGMRWALRQMTARLRFLEREHRTYPSSDLQRTITNLRYEVAKFQEDVENLEEGDEPLTEAAEKNGCSVSYSAYADAYHQTSVQGVAASASASFNNTCGYYAETNATAYSRATRGTLVETLTQDDPKTGYVINSNAVSSVPGGPDCYSEAYAFARYSPQSIFHSAFDSNSLCPVPAEPPTVTISGPTAVGFSYPTSACVLRSWTSTVSGGSSPYTYQWYENGYPVGTGTSYSRTVCPYDQGGFDLSLTVTGSNGLSGNDTHWVNVVVFNAGGGGGTCGTRLCLEENTNK